MTPKRMGPDLEERLRSFHEVRPNEEAADEPQQPDIGRVGARTDDSIDGILAPVWVCTTCGWQVSGRRTPSACADCASQDSFVRQEM